MKDVVIVSGCRTAIGGMGGGLKDVPGIMLAKTVIEEAVKRAKIDPKLVEDVRMGCCFDPIDSSNIARAASIKAGIPDAATACTINRVCISGMEATISGMAMIQAGMADVIMAGGVESMSNIPYMLPKARWGARLQDFGCEDAIIHGLRGGSLFNPYPKDGPMEAFRGKSYIMGETAEFVAKKYGITRKEQDEVALRSHNNAERATKNGDFKEEIVPVEITSRKGTTFFDKDEHFRPGLTMDQLEKLPPAFMKDGTVTAGNSSGLNDGASAMVIMSADKAKELGIKPLAKIKAIGRCGNEPYLMGAGPIFSVNNLLKRSGMKIGDFQLIEINEAFAAQYVACEKELKLNREIVNINGSGIGLGHPVGSTGARLIVTLIHAMKKNGKTLGLASLCGGGGVSMAAAIEMI